MIVNTEYVAEDGKPFATEKECREYEKTLREQQVKMAQIAMKEIDAKIWKKYYPGKNATASEPELHVACIWLKNDIVEILCDESLSVSMKDILSIIKENDYSDTILTDYISVDEIVAEVEIRRDFETAFSKVKYGGDLSYKIGWAISKRDLKNLAALHKTGKCKSKIEELLEDCNFHYECSKFSKGEYDKFLEV